MSRIIKDLNEIFKHLEKDWTYLRNSNILISGATGFFGKSIILSLIHANNLKNLNLKIYIISRDQNPLKHFKLIKDNHGVIRHIKTDIRDFKIIDLEINFIIHAATNSNSEFIKNNPDLTFDTIVNGTRKLLEFSLTQKKLKSFLFISSGAVNSANNIHTSPISEENVYSFDINDKNFSYASGKKNAEESLMEYYQKHNLPVKILRGFSFIGPQINLNHNLVLTYILNCFLMNKDINILNSQCKRSFMYTSDLVIWIIKVLIYAKPGKTYNLGSDEEVTIEDLAKKFLKYNNKIKLIKSNYFFNDYYIPNINKIQQDLNLEINVSLDESINRLITFYQEL